eukprot:3381855-Prymnesium_polylepis.2
MLGTRQSDSRARPESAEEIERVWAEASERDTRPAGRCHRLSLACLTVLSGHDTSDVTSWILASCAPVLGRLCGRGAGVRGAMRLVGEGSRHTLGAAGAGAGVGEVLSLVSARGAGDVRLVIEFKH